MAIIKRNRLTDPNLDQIAWAEHALEEYGLQKYEGTEQPVLSQTLAEEAAAIGGIPHELLAAAGIRLVSRTRGEYWYRETRTPQGENDG